MLLRVDVEDIAVFVLTQEGPSSSECSYIVVFNVVAELGGVQVFTPVVFGAVRCPMRRLDRTAARRADDPSLTHHPPVLRPRYGALLWWTLVPHAQRPLLVFLLLPLLLPFLLALGPVARPVGGAHQFLAFVVNVFVAVVLRGVAPQRLQLVVDRRFLGLGRSLALFLPLAGPPNANHNAEDPEDAEDDAQHRDQVTWRRKSEEA